MDYDCHFMIEDFSLAFLWKMNDNQQRKHKPITLFSAQDALCCVSILLTCGFLVKNKTSLWPTCSEASLVVIGIQIMHLIFYFNAQCLCYRDGCVTQVHTDTNTSDVLIEEVRVDLQALFSIFQGNHATFSLLLD